MSQLFYAWRIWNFSGKKWVPILIVMVSAISDWDTQRLKVHKLSLLHTSAGLYDGILIAIVARYSIRKFACNYPSGDFDNDIMSSKCKRGPTNQLLYVPGFRWLWWSLTLSHPLFLSHRCGLWVHRPAILSLPLAWLITYAVQSQDSVILSPS